MPRIKAREPYATHSHHIPLAAVVVAALVVVTIVVVAIVVSGVLLPNATVVINGVSNTYRGNTTYAQLQEEYGTLEPGNLMAVDGSLLETGGGAPGVVIVNGEPVQDFNARVVNGSEVEWRLGSDALEAHDDVAVPIAHQQVSEGNQDDSLCIYMPGADGADITRTGLVSGKVVQLHNDPVNSRVVYYDPHPTEKVIALTLDDGPGPYTVRILDVLDKYGVKATFFTLGKMYSDFPNEGRAYAQRGHQVASHSWSHLDQTKQDTATARSEWIKSLEAIREYTGVETKVARAPYGYFGLEDWKRCGDLINTMVRWDIDSNDWSSSTSAEGITQYIMEEAYSGAVVLFHDAGGNREKTIATLDTLVPQLQAEGYRFVTIDELVNLAPPPTSAL
jgi:peptidoglycan/xylan/chitin deacetylase (PgdA/CDA1 family)/sulfur carrier protein ThiS